MRAAAVGIGSNSTRMLAAEIGAGQIAPFLRLREDTRLFSSLENGALSAERMMHTAATAAMLAERARGEGCETLRLFATSATRDAPALVREERERRPAVATPRGPASWR